LSQLSRSKIGMCRNDFAGYGFHKDPADQIIVATSMILRIPLLTADEKIIAYPDIKTLE
jgi:PIN domain nuclease of toxin-antitoxin system